MVDQIKNNTIAPFINDVNTLIIHMKSKKVGSRCSSRIEMSSSESVFDYVTISRNTRSYDKKREIQSYLNVITSDRIKHRTEVQLLEAEKSIIVRMKREEYERSPRIALIRTDIRPEVIERVQTMDPEYKDFGDVFEYVFDDVEEGSYYLFIEPLFLF